MRENDPVGPICPTFMGVKVPPTLFSLHMQEQALEPAAVVARISKYGKV